MIPKITKPCGIQYWLLLIYYTLTAATIAAQDSTKIYPPVTSSMMEYHRQVLQVPAKIMIELKSLIPGLRYDLRYAGTDNFMKRRMYPARTSKTFLRMPAAMALKKVQEELAQQGLGLKIFDAYRPFSVTVMFWELVKDERYVANPAKGSGHNRGIAVDLTIIDLKTGTELDMGTGFDNFTDTAHHSFTALPENVLANRKLLKGLMETAGFKAFESEWWHYFLAGSESYEILDLKFRELAKLKKIKVRQSQSLHQY